MTSTLSSDGRARAPLIRLDRISKRFEEAGHQRVVLHEVSAAFWPSEFAVLVGKSGSGAACKLVKIVIFTLLTFHTRLCYIAWVL